MNKSIRSILVLLFLLAVTSGYAQTFLPQLGITYYNTAINENSIPTNYQNTGFKRGFTAGISYELGLEQNFSLQAGLVFNQKGFTINTRTKEDINLDYYEYGANFLVNYLELPVFVKYSFHAGKIIISPKLGIYVSYGLGGKVNQYQIWEDNTGVIHNDSYSGDIKFESYKPQNGNNVYVEERVDGGLLASVEVQVLKRLILDLRYSYGFNGFEFCYAGPTPHRGFLIMVSVPVKSPFKRK